MRMRFYLLRVVSFCALCFFFENEYKALASVDQVDSQLIDKESEDVFLSQIRAVTIAGARSGEGYFRRDGQYFVFQSERESANPFYQIYLMNWQNGNTQRISAGFGKTTCAWIHPFQNQVLYASTHLDPRALEKQKQELKIRASGPPRRYAWDYDENYDLFVSDFNGKKTRRLTFAKGYDAEASFSPDGEWIVFASNRSGYTEKLSPEDEKNFRRDPSYEMDIYLMRSNGKDLKRLTHQKGYDGGPFFSADGEHITWRHFSPDGRSAEIFIMDRDGSNQKELTKFNKISWAPFFHPSGDYLIFSGNLKGDHNFDLFVMRTDGQGRAVQVTNHSGFDGLATFTPDGRELVWTSGRSQQGSSQIFRAQWNDQEIRRSLGLEESSNKNLPSSFYQMKLGMDRDGYEKHVRYLSSEKMGGRLTGSEGEKLAATYIENFFKFLGLEKLDGLSSYLQPFSFTQKVELGKGNYLSLDFNHQQQETKLQLQKDWVPLHFSANGEISEGDLVFAGYGLRVPATKDFSGYDSFQQLEVKNKWLMVFRYFPEKINPQQKQILSRYSTLRDKAMLARDLGAKGLIIVSGPSSQVKDQLIPFVSNEVSGSMSIPVISITDKVAEALLANKKISLKDYQKELDEGTRAQSSIELGSIPWKGFIELNRVKGQGFNVLARIPREKKESHQQAVVIGAHYDHLGSGHQLNSLAREEERGKIHFGADDNASGVAGVLELADEMMYRWRTKNQNFSQDVIFALWSGEELGTLGSNHFIKEMLGNGKQKLKISSYVNMDMIGRYEKQLMIQGVGSSPTWNKILERPLFQSSLFVSIQADPYLPTDSTSFYLAKVPVINFFTGAHEDYHTPRDIADKIHYDRAFEVLQIVSQVTEDLVQTKHPLSYTEVQARVGGSGPGRQMRIYLGTIPNYGDESGKGLLLSGTQKGGPAEKAGLQAGDFVIEIGGHRIENIYDYTNALERLEVGKSTSLIVNRKGQQVKLTIIPSSRE